jgi:hypothetical protein
VAEDGESTGEKKSMTPELLIERGYRQYDKHACAGKLADELFQKKIDGKYFINIFRYFQNYNAGCDGWQPEVQFNTHMDQPPTFNVTLCGALSIDEIEAFFARMYERMDCKPYDDE